VLKAILRRINPAGPKLCAPERREPEASAPVTKKPYVRPEVRELGTEQGILILVGRAWSGDKGARDLLELIFPEPGEMPSSPSKVLDSMEQPLKGR